MLNFTSIILFVSMSKLYLKNWSFLNWFFSSNWRRVEPRINDREFCACLPPSLQSSYRAMDQLIIGLTMTEPEEERFFLKIYSVNNSPRSVIYDFRISHVGWIRVRRRIQHPEKRLVDQTPAGGRPWKWGNFSGTNLGLVIRISISHA